MKRHAGVAVMLAGSSVIAMLLNFLFQAYLAYLFGARGEMDAYVAAMTMPAWYAAVAVPSLSIVLIPLFVESMRTRGIEATWNTVSSVLNLVAVFVVVASVLMVLAAAPAIHLLFPSLAPSTASIAAQLLRWLFPATMLTSIVVLLIGIDQAEERFRPTAIAPIIGAAALLLVSVLLAPAIGVVGVAIASLVSSVAQMLWLLPTLRHKWRGRIDLRDVVLRRFTVLLAPLVGGGVLSRATTVADRIAASHLAPGSLSHVEYANRIVGVILTIFVAGLASALYPVMSASAATRNLQELRETMLWGQKLLVLLLFPALAVAWVVRIPLVQLLFQRGAFRLQDTRAVASLLTWFLLGVVGGALGTLQARVYYVLQDTRTPVILGSFEALAYFVYLQFFVRAWDVAGIGIANVVYLTSAFVVNGFVVQRKLQLPIMGELAMSVVRLASLALVAAVGAFAVARCFGAPCPAVMAATVTGTAIYGGLLLLLRPPEARNAAGGFGILGVGDDPR